MRYSKTFINAYKHGVFKNSNSKKNPILINSSIYFFLPSNWTNLRWWGRLAPLDFQ